MKNIKTKKYPKNAGFTIMETMISVTLFLVVVISGVNVLLNVNLISKKTEDVRSVVDSLSFIMEEMSRNIRTGYNYRCYGPWEPGDAQASILNTPQSCESGGAIVFEESDGIPGSNNTSDQWVYKIESVDFGATYNLFKSIDGGLTFVQLNPNEVVLESVSGFSVLGAEPPASNLQQPFVNINLVGSIEYKGTVTPFSLQTSVSQRLVDVGI